MFNRNEIIRRIFGIVCASFDSVVQVHRHFVHFLIRYVYAGIVTSSEDQIVLCITQQMSSPLCQQTDVYVNIENKFHSIVIPYYDAYDGQTSLDIRALGSEHIVKYVDHVS